MDIAIIYGGKSGEHEISIISATAIVRNIPPSYSVILIGIAKDGKWYLQDSSLVKKVKEDKNLSLSIAEEPSSLITLLPGEGCNSFICSGHSLHIDVAFPVLHGSYGEDGTIQGVFEMLNIAYVGCNHTASAIGMDKDLTKNILIAIDVPIVPYILLTRAVYENKTSLEQTILQLEDHYPYPLFVKPASCGSSNGTSCVNDRDELVLALDEAFTWGNKVLVERAINAREIECAVMGNSGIKDVYVPTFMAAGEIKPSHEFYDFDAKYTDKEGASLEIPADISEEMEGLLKDYALKVYTKLGCTGLARLDFFIDKDSGFLYFNEINTIPGFTSISMFPKLCEYSGCNFPHLIDCLIQEALHLYEDKKRIKTSR